MEEFCQDYFASVPNKLVMFVLYFNQSKYYYMHTWCHSLLDAASRTTMVNQILFPQQEFILCDVRLCRRGGIVLGTPAAAGCI